MERSQSMMVVFDLGGVLVPPEGSIAALSALLDVPATDLAPVYWSVRDAYDRGGPATDFWAAVTDGLGRDADHAELDRTDAAHWADLGPGIIELLGELVDQGRRLAVLSNAPASLASVVRAAPWSSVFESLVFSCDTGLMKPEAAAYELAQDRFGAPAAELFFLDDRPANVEAARRAGWQAELWTDLDSARRTLVDAGALDD